MEQETTIEKIETLESEIRDYANTLPYWGKYLANQILSGHEVTDDNITSAYSFLLEDLHLKEKSDRPEITLGTRSINATDYKSNLLFSKLENVEGVNALVENQTIDFSKNLTVIYGTNGSGKSGYVRLLKQVFYSKSPETILSNVYNENEPKPINAKFTFKSNNDEISLTFSDKDKSEFKQFAVFDGKSVLKHLENKNEFEFRPAGLNFFADYIEAIKRVEEKLNADIQKKQLGNTATDLADLFDNDSEIKVFVRNLNAETTSDDLQKYIPFSDEDKARKESLQKQYDELLLASKGKEKEIKKLENLKILLSQNKEAIEKLNLAFAAETITKLQATITDCISKELAAKQEGVDNFKTDLIQGIGSDEWKNFILSADKFAKMQKNGQSVYPTDSDHCLLCHQPLSDDAQKLISSYWVFIKSVAEQNAKQAQEKLEKVRRYYEGLNFDLFPQNNTLTDWLTEQHPEELKLLKQKLNEQKSLSENILSDIQNKTVNIRQPINVDVERYNALNEVIDAKLNNLQSDEQSKALETLRKEKTFLEHKEKFNIHFSKFETYVTSQIWIKKAQRADFAKHNVTNKEKALSNKYFNQKYIDGFNDECMKLNGNFGIEINHTGSGGKSYRQLKLKGKNPNSVLSEGEQKVIAIADFLAEIQLSEINKGIVFDDPVTSLDEKRKSEIAERLAQESLNRQVIIFTHDLVFVSNLLIKCESIGNKFLCHWIENCNGKPGQIWLNNSPSYEMEYRNAEPVKKHYVVCSKNDCSPMQRENEIKQGFTALRTCYEVLVIKELFNNVVQRYNERVSIDSLTGVVVTDELVKELMNAYGSCCRFMEGHSHSDNFQYKKPTPDDLNVEIQSYEAIRKKIKEAKKSKSK